MSSRLSISLSLLVGLLALAGLGAIIVYLPPTSTFMGLALVLLLVSITGLTMPFWRLLLRRLLSEKDEGRLMAMSLRFGLWSGVFATSLVLLKLLNFMDSVLILAILALLIMMEMFFQQTSARRRSTRRTRR